MRALLWIGILAVATALPACRSGKPLAGKPPKALEARNSEELLKALWETRTHSAAAHYYSARADIAYTSGTDSRSFKAHLRLVRDSAAWISIVPVLGIEVARAMLTTDSLLVLDKLHDTYWAGDTAAARKRFGMEPGLGLFQEALLGLPIGLDPQDKYRSGQENGMYTLTTKERRRFVRAAEDLAPGDTLPNDRDMPEKRLERILRKANKREAMVYKYWIDPDSMCVARVLISDLAHDRVADVRYPERTLVDGKSFPATVILSLSAPGHAVSGTLHLDRILLNGPLNLPFRIPEKFKPME